MKVEMRVEQPVTVPAAAAQPKKEWQRPCVQQLRISLDTAFSLGSNADGFDGSLL